MDVESAAGAWSPYLVGALIGVLSMATFYFSDKPLGVSTSYARLAGLIGNLFSKEHTETLKFYQDKKPKIEWGVMLMFGVGLGLLGYCPGTGAAALGQGNYDAIAGIAGLLAGSYLYAETSARLSATIQKIGNRGGIMLPDLLGMRLTVFLTLFVPLLFVSLFALERLTT
jgi:hypothetical protein